MTGIEPATSSGDTMTIGNHKPPSIGPRLRAAQGREELNRRFSVSSLTAVRKDSIAAHRKVRLR
jgi:hypothetical protein